MGTQWGPSPPQQFLPTFGPYLLWPNGRPSQQLLSSCGNKCDNQAYSQNFWTPNQTFRHHSLYHCMRTAPISLERKRRYGPRHLTLNCQERCQTKQKRPRFGIDTAYRREDDKTGRRRVVNMAARPLWSSVLMRTTSQPSRINVPHRCIYSYWHFVCLEEG